MKKLSTTDRIAIKAYAAFGVSVKTIARQYQVSQKLIAQIINSAI